jgi:CHAT domain-containing protein
VEAACRHFPEPARRVLAGPQAHEDAVKAALGFGAEKLFSTHGLFVLEDIEQSFLALHGEGRLRARDLAGAEEEPPAEAPAAEAEVAASGARAALRGLGFAPKSRSFGHPYWWAAFQCMGAGWVPASGE